MKLPRNAKVFHGRLDVAPFAGVFFLLVLFLLLGSLIYTPGVAIQLPVAAELPGSDRTTVAVAVDAHGRLYFDNQVITPAALLSRLRSVVRKSSQPVTMMVQADREVSHQYLIDLSVIARDSGITEAFLATQPPLSAPVPRIFSTP